MESEEPEVHVTPYGAGWAVRTATDATPLLSAFDARHAVSEARSIARSRGAELVVFDAAWQVKWRRQYAGR